MGVLVALAAALVGLCAFASPASAGLGGQPGTGTPPPSPPPSSGSSGAPAHTTARNCSLYATSSSFGLDCVTGNGTDHAKTVQQILGAVQPPPTCWDKLIPAADLSPRYWLRENPDAPYYMHTCLVGLVLKNSLYDQPDLQVNQQVIEIPKGAPDCPTDAAHLPFKITQKGVCVMTLIGNQHTVVEATALAGGQIPGITIVTHPSSKIRTNEDVAYEDAGTNGDHAVITPKYKVGGVTMWAEMGSYKIYPYGPNANTVRNCTGTERVGPTDTPATKPDACWWTYPLSSAGQQNQVYPFRAQAGWTVYYSAGGPAKTLASFVKWDDLNVPVSDIQTVVIN